MNLYIIVEGKTSEKKVYPAWISRLNARLSEIDDLGDFSENCYMIVSGMGYPYYFDVIDNAIADVVGNSAIDYLVICVDSEDMAFDEKRREINDHVAGRIPGSRLKIVVQHFCLETWALGNKVIHKRNPEDRVLREYIRCHDARVRDPELLPEFPRMGFNRAQFAADYLRRTLREKYSRLSYTKKDPTLIAHSTYFDRILARYSEDKHIQSFGQFLDAFG